MGVTTFCLSIHLSVDVGCFHLLCIVNNAAMNMVCKYLLKTLLSILLGIYLGVELLGHTAILIFLKLFSSYCNVLFFQLNPKKIH